MKKYDMIYANENVRSIGDFEKNVTDWDEHDNFNNKTIFNELTGEVYSVQDCVFSLIGIDENLLHQIKQTRDARSYKENTAFKIIERQCKRDAYETALRYLKLFPQDIEKILNEKIDSHNKYLDEQDIYYVYASQTFAAITGRSNHENI